MLSARRPCCAIFFRLLFSVVGQIVDFGTQFGGDGQLFRRHRVVQFVEQIDGEIGKIVDEVERVLDLVRDAGGKLAERGHLLRLHQPVLRAAQIDQRGLGDGACPAGVLEQPRVLDGKHGLAGERLQQCGDGRRETTRNVAADHQPADDLVLAQQRHGEHGMDAP